MNDARREKMARLRHWAVVAVMLAWAGGVLWRAYDLQVRSRDRLESLAERQHTARVTLQARRGMILDRNGEELAISLPVESVFVQPALIQDRRGTAKKLARVLGLNAKDLEKKFSESNRNFAWVDRHVASEKIQDVRALELPGIGFIEESRRHYPGGERAAQLLGFAGIDSVGLEGAERAFDKYLRGSPEEVIGDRDARGRAILARGMGPLERLQGDNVVLTLDATVQHIAEREAALARKETGSKAAAALVMDPRTGEILGMAIEPRFDPNHFEKYGKDRFRNRIVTDLFEPGSTFKPFLLAASLDAGAVDEDDIFFCENGSYKVRDRTFHDHKPHGWLSAANILRVSSNIGSIKIADRIGGSRYYEYLRRFGFGRRTGIELGGEGEGILLPPSKWSGVSLATMAFGQGVGVTALQLLSATSALANDGVLLRPRILKEVRDPMGEVIHRTIPEVRDRVVSESVAHRVTKVMRGVVSEEGTGVLAELPGYSVAGKTGTSQKIDPATGAYSQELRIVSFVGFAPATSPRVAVLVLLDEPKEKVTGGAVAAPVFARITGEVLSYLEVPPDQPVETPAEPAVATDETESAPAMYWGASAMQGAWQTISAAVAGGEEGTPSFLGKPLREVL
ncbi:MAG: penicillin-binding protein 2, partial [Bdellovibrionota bacterium]